MQIIFQCPVCEERSVCRPEPATGPVQCQRCDWSRDEGQQDFDGEFCRRCRVCGCEDLWRQKDFPPAVGLGFVVAGGLLSTIAWYQHEPIWALGILMAFAFVDMMLYTFMTDMLVCYRCRARHRKTALDNAYPAFDLELSERYVQMKKRQDAATKDGSRD
ncbi:hypothetical protein [Fuerstiella marisgermanici]|uniref:Uncharacterized protein n=1 Tax=Fuerstiella marisgermanici TaxID=1891926 RepID=A0A1P8WMP6_9PLAN|nr:hypothetical protein [Fuerstiella marisgermanici]APZ95326.1 hypothetical protein Fuma_04982 [Fuerstiella marisgermanici]